MLEGHLTSQSNTVWREATSSQTDVHSAGDTTDTAVQFAFWEMCIDSRRCIEQCRIRDLHFLETVERSWRQMAQQFTTTLAVVEEDASRSREELYEIEQGHWTLIQRLWQGQLRLDVDRQQRDRLIDATAAVDKRLRHMFGMS